MGHRLVFYENRSTPQVVGEKGSAKSKEGYGKVSHSRPANAQEEKTIARGGWVRVDSKGNKPSSASYKASSYRPQLGAKRRATNAKIAKMLGAGKIVRPASARPMSNGFPKPKLSQQPPVAKPSMEQRKLLGFNINPLQKGKQMDMNRQKISPIGKSDIKREIKSKKKDIANKLEGPEKLPDNVSVALPNAAVKAYDRSGKNKKKAFAQAAGYKIAGVGAGAGTGYAVYRVSRGKIKTLNRPGVKLAGKKFPVSRDTKRGAASSAATSIGGSIGGYIGSRKSLDNVKSSRKYDYREK